MVEESYREYLIQVDPQQLPQQDPSHSQETNQWTANSTVMKIGEEGIEWQTTSTDLPSFSSEEEAVQHALAVAREAIDDWFAKGK